MESLNKNQFVYKRERNIPGTKEDTEKGIIGTDPYTETVYDSFNIECVIRSISLDDGKRLLLLDDLHERYQEGPKKGKNGKISIIREKDAFQSEIYLSKEEGIEYLKLTSVNKF